MKNIKSRKLLAILLTLMISLSLLPLSAFTVTAAPPPTGDDIFFDLTGLGYNWTYVDASGDNVAYYKIEGVEYVANPTVYADSTVAQLVNIFVPAAYLNNDGTVNTSVVQNGYTADIAPIILNCNNGGWNAGPLGNVNNSYINAGFVHISASNRGRNLLDGKSPASVSDLKAVVRFMKLYDDILPGDSERIISVGGSGGGGTSTSLGASGNLPNYYEDLFNIGAAGMTDAATSTISDAIYGSASTAPIQDLVNADVAYAWFRHAVVEYEAAKDSRYAFDAFELALQEDMADDFVDYVNELFDAAPGSEILDSRRVGSYYDEILDEISKSLNRYLDYNFGDGPSAEREAYIDAMPNDDGDHSEGFDNWYTYNATTGIATVVNLDGYIYNNREYNINNPNWETDFWGRNKYIPSFDTLDFDVFGGEATAFGPGNTGAEWSHYAFRVANIINDNYATYAGIATTDEVGYMDAFIEDLITPATYTSLIADQTFMYNAVAMIKDGNSDVAEHWRIRTGAADQHTSFTVGYNIARMLGIKYPGVTVDYSLVWRSGHGTSEVDTGTGSFVEWVESITDKQPPPAVQDQLTLKETLTPKLDGEDISVDWYTAAYVADPYKIDGLTPAIQQQVNVYVPENATEDSPIILMLANGGWLMNTYPTNTILSYATTPNTVGDYSSTGNDVIGAALNAGYVVVSYGCRSRGQQEDVTNNYIGHSPATVADTKAVISYLRWSADEGSVAVGDTDRIVVTGTSGGGALSTLICATGNSEDFFEELYNMGTAGVWIGLDGKYHSDYGDDVFATIAYCPITDLPNADAAYEWTYNETRHAYADNSEIGFPAGADPDVICGPLTLDASDALVAEFVSYFNALNLEDEDGGTLKADDDTFKDAVIGLLEKGVEKAMAELDAGSVLPNVMDDYDWLTIDAGKAAIVWDEFLYWVGLQTALKGAPAFDNFGTTNQSGMNENNLVGRLDQAYSHWLEWSWDNDTGAVSGVGVGSSSWAAFLASADGELVMQQAKMLTPIPYLVGNESDVTPYWYVRHGMADRDTSFAVGSTLYYALLNNNNVKVVDFNFAWLKLHSGNYDVPEAFEWLAEVLALEDANAAANVAVDAAVAALPNGSVTANITGLPTANVTYESSDASVASYSNGTITINQPAAGAADATVTITVHYVASDGINYINLIYGTATFTVSAQTSSGNGGGGSGGGGGGTVTTPPAHVTVTKPDNGNIALSNENPEIGDEVIVTITPNEGFKLDTLTITDKDGNKIPFTDNGDGTFTFVYEGVDVIIEATFIPLAAAPTNPFIDINTYDWFYEYVIYAYEHGLMLGTSDDVFSPNLTASRAMIVTVLWRIVGSPEAAGTNAFTDLRADWYMTAVQWAVNNGITNGISETQFAPDMAVTREQLATLLYRFAECMDYDVSASNDLSGFTDVGSISGYAIAAMEWANAMGIFTGDTETTLTPKASSTRAVLATVLMRFCEAYDVFGENQVDEAA